ncbi:MAG: hypothetical protein WC829_04510 [Hyphomicrobium sp.]|jgi:hypothetical protein
MGEMDTSTLVPLASNPPSGFTRITNVFTKDITFTAGAITALTGVSSQQTVTGLLTTDHVVVECTAAMVAGATIANAYVSATDTLQVVFTTAVALGVTLGALTYRVTVFR